MSDEPRRIPIHRSINRHHTLLGGERRLVLGGGLAAALIAFSGLTLLMAFIGIVSWMFMLAALQRLAKVDPQMSEVYIRHRNYKAYYRPASGYLAPPRSVKAWKS